MNSGLQRVYKEKLESEKSVIDSHYATLKVKVLDGGFVHHETLSAIVDNYGFKVSRAISAKLDNLPVWSTEIGDEKEYKILPKSPRLLADCHLKLSHTKVSPMVLLLALEKVSDMLHEELESLKL